MPDVFHSGEYKFPLGLSPVVGSKRQFWGEAQIQICVLPKIFDFRINFMKKKKFSILILVTFWINLKFSNFQIFRRWWRHPWNPQGTPSRDPQQGPPAGVGIGLGVTLRGKVVLKKVKFCSRGKRRRKMMNTSCTQPCTRILQTQSSIKMMNTALIYCTMIDISMHAFYVTSFRCF